MSILKVFTPNISVARAKKRKEQAAAVALKAHQYADGVTSKAVQQRQADIRAGAEAIANIERSIIVSRNDIVELLK